jgi:uncharacterized protein (DUF433 family)
MDYRQIITVEPGKRSGQPCIRGMRMTVRDVLEYLAGGMSVEELLADFPELTGKRARPSARRPQAFVSPEWWAGNSSVCGRV